MVSPTHGDAVARLRLAVVRLARQIRQHARTGVTPSQLSALSTLDRHGPMRLADLADHEGIARSTITRIVRQLEDGGLLTRAADPNDGRCAIATLSPTGKSLLTDARGRAQAFLTERIAALPDLTATQIDEVAAVLERVAARPAPTGAPTLTGAPTPGATPLTGAPTPTGATPPTGGGAPQGQRG
ncbi:MAG TPA: MarR family transcriptional regulator [Euzebyales bacterium]|nr:MarR family transcriptional regulator [Euzebyales bacterium]